MKRVGKELVWSQEDIDLLKEKGDTLSFFDIGLMLGVSSATVRNKAKELGITHGTTFNRSCVWKDEQIEYLCKNYATSTVSDLSDYLGFSSGTINRMAEKLGLKKDTSRRNNYVARYVKNYKNNERDFSKQRENDCWC